MKIFPSALGCYWTINEFCLPNTARVYVGPFTHISVLKENTKTTSGCLRIKRVTGMTVIIKFHWQQWEHTLLVHINNSRNKNRTNLENVLVNHATGKCNHGLTIPIRTLWWFYVKKIVASKDHSRNLQKNCFMSILAFTWMVENGKPMLSTPSIVRLIFSWKNQCKSCGFFN